MKYLSITFIAIISLISSEIAFSDPVSHKDSILLQNIFIEAGAGGIDTGDYNGIIALGADVSKNVYFEISATDHDPDAAHSMDLGNEVFNEDIIGFRMQTKQLHEYVEVKYTWNDMHKLFNWRESASYITGLKLDLNNKYAVYAESTNMLCKYGNFYTVGTYYTISPNWRAEVFFKTPHGRDHKRYVGARVRYTF